jgi:hypothetical protein
MRTIVVFDGEKIVGTKYVIEVVLIPICERIGASDFDGKRILCVRRFEVGILAYVFTM